MLIRYVRVCVCLLVCRIANVETCARNSCENNVRHMNCVCVGTNTRECNFCVMINGKCALCMNVFCFRMYHLLMVFACTCDTFAWTNPNVRTPSGFPIIWSNVYSFAPMLVQKLVCKIVYTKLWLMLLPLMLFIQFACCSNRSGSESCSFSMHMLCMHTQTLIRSRDFVQKRISAGE